MKKLLLLLLIVGCDVSNSKNSNQCSNHNALSNNINRNCENLPFDEYTDFTTIIINDNYGNSLEVIGDEIAKGCIDDSSLSLTDSICGCDNLLNDTVLTEFIIPEISISFDSIYYNILNDTAFLDIVLSDTTFPSFPDIELNDTLINPIDTMVIFLDTTEMDLFSFTGDFDITEILLNNYDYEISITVSPAYTGMSPAYPNPFNMVTSFNISIPQTQPVEIYIVDQNYNIISNLYSGVIDVGMHSFQWNASEYVEGYYRIIMVAENTECFMNIHKL